MTREALLAAIHAAPDDDTPRLVYADYLEENGEVARAEFIRIQCELARLSPRVRQAKILKHRERILLARHGRDWVHELGELEGVIWQGFERGFITKVGVADLKVLTRWANAIPAMAPVTGVRVQNLSGPIPTSPIPWVTELAVADRYQFNQNEFAELLNSRLCEHLTGLDLAGVGVENAGAETIARAAGLNRLVHLNLSNCFVGQAGVQRLAEAKHLSRLQTLVFSSLGSGYVEDPFVTDAGVEWLATSPVFENLTRLGLGGNNISAASVQTLLRSVRLKQLKTVDLSCIWELQANAFTPCDGPARWTELRISNLMQADIVATIARHPQLQSLERLVCRGTPINSAGCEALAQSALPGTMRELILGGCGLKSDGVIQLAQASWPRLTVLDLRGCDVGTAGAKALAEAAEFPELHTLDLTECKLSGPGVTTLASAAWLPNVRRLRLARNKLSVAAVETLLESPIARELTELDLTAALTSTRQKVLWSTCELPAMTDLTLRECALTDDDLAAMARFVPQLVTLDVSESSISPVGMTALATADAVTLTELNLESCTQLGSKGLAAFLTGLWPMLDMLRISNCNLPASAIDALCQSELARRLRRVTYWGNQLPKDPKMLRELLRSEFSVPCPWLVAEDDEDLSSDY